MKRGAWVAGISAILLTACMIGAGAGLAGSVNPELNVGGSFRPNAISKTAPTPIGLNFSGRLDGLGQHSDPVLESLVIETDRDGAIDVRGIPACNPNLQVQAASAKDRCASATIGRGTARIEVAYPEEEAKTLKGTLQILNGGMKDGVTTLYARVRTAGPVGLAATVKITRLRRGTYGTRAVVTIPKIASGVGSIVAFKAKIPKREEGKSSAGLLTLACPDGDADARITAILSGGVEVAEAVDQLC
jgi:hypothetical protein